MKILNIAIIVVAVVMTSCNYDKHKNHEVSTFLVTRPLKTDTIIHHEYIGQVRSIQHIEIRSLEEGYLQNIYVDEGQFVKKGQLLFQIMPSIYQAEMQKAQAEVDFAKIEYQNTKSLADSNIVSPNELALSKANYDKAKADLALAQAHLNFTEVKAPFDGIIGRFNEVRLGSLLEEGELLTTLSDNTNMWVYYNVPEAKYLDFANQQNDAEEKPLVDLKMANGKFFESKGVVETIEADFNNETGNIAFRATFQNPNALLRHGQTGNVFMPIQLKNALLIPQEATFEILDKKYVYTISKHKVEAKQIEVEHEWPHLYQVVSGITEQDTILVEGLRKVSNGQEIDVHFKKLTEILQELNQLHAE